MGLRPTRDLYSPCTGVGLQDQQHELEIHKKLEKKQARTEIKLSINI
jgi:hypothetical protein